MPHIDGESKYFLRKYGNSNPVFFPEKEVDFHREGGVAAYVYLGRALAEGLPLDGNTIYGHINGLGEFVHKSELIND